MSFSFQNPNSHNRKNLPSENDRLEKAIARNRAKQERKDFSSTRPIGGPPSPQVARTFRSPNHRPPPPPSFPVNGNQRVPVRNHHTNQLSNEFQSQGRVGNLKAPNRSLNEVMTTKKGPLLKLKMLLQRNEGKKNKTLPIVNRAMPTTSTLKKKTLRRTKNQSPPKSKLALFFVGLLVKLGWLFSCALLLQLIFSERGVLDYYDKKVVWEEKIYEVKFMAQENEDLKVDIERISRDVQYQKKLVRDNLGFIAEDEFLVLFPEGKKRSI